jgi:hypothetical protein
MDALKKELTELNAITNALQYDVNALMSGTKTAATSSRAKLLKLSKLCGQMRKTVMTAKGDIPTRSRTKKLAVAAVVEEKTRIDGSTPLLSDDDESDEADTLTQQFERKVAIEKTKRVKKAKRSKRGMRLGV